MASRVEEDLANLDLAERRLAERASVRSAAREKRRAAYAAAAALATLGLQLVLTFGAAFLLLGLGPAE